MEEKEVTKADINQFIRDVQSAGYYSKKIIAINCQLEAINIELVGVASIAPKDYMIENKKPFSHQGMLSLIEDESKLISQRNEHEQFILSVDKLFNRLPFNIQLMMVDLYIRELNHTKVAKHYGFDRAYMHRLIKKEIKKLKKSQCDR